MEPTDMSWMTKQTDTVVTKFKKFATTVYWLAFIGIVGLGWMKYDRWEKANQKVWADANCPALLSIGRSARDTLITMKSLDSCNKFVLDNLK